MLVVRAGPPEPALDRAAEAVSAGIRAGVPDAVILDDVVLGGPQQLEDEAIVRAERGARRLAAEHDGRLRMELGVEVPPAGTP